ncbi:MAG: ATP-dependent DNA helicase RecG, partial [Rhodospirillaceae bacterium]
MRPESLYPLFAPLATLPRVSPRLASLLERLAGPHVVDLLWHLPTAVIDRRFMPKVMEAPAGRVATLAVRVDTHLLPLSPRHPYRVRCSDETGYLHLVFFHAKANHLKRLLPEGTMRIVSGQVEHFNNEIQISHPNHIAALDQADVV